MQELGRPVAGWTAGTKILVWMMVAWTLVDLVLFATAYHVLWARVVLDALVVAQFATLAGWLALGDGELIVRAFCVAVAVLISELMAQAAGTADGSRANLGEMAALVATHIVTVSLPLFAAATLGWRCRRNDESPTSERPFQFRIAQVLVLTAVVGAMLGLWRVMHERMVWMTMFVGITALALSPLVAAQWFLQLRPRPGLVWLVALLVEIGYCAAAILFFYRGEPLVIAALALYAATLGINLALFRVWGYRLLRRLA
jgi:hypothetical protein